MTTTNALPIMIPGPGLMLLVNLMGVPTALANHEQTNRIPASLTSVPIRLHLLDRDNWDWRNPPTWFLVAICCIFLWIVFAVWAQSRFGSYRFALEYIQGATIQVIPAKRALGVHPPDDRFQTTVTLRNHGNTPVMVVAALADCTCVANSDLPLSIPGGQSVILPVSIRFPHAIGDWRVTISYLTDDARQSTVRVFLDGRVFP